MKGSLSKRESNRQRWFQLIQEWQTSGLSQKAFCEAHQLGLASFQRWRRIFMGEAHEVSTPPVGFLPVKVVEPSTSGLSLVINEGMRIEVSAGFDAITLKQLVQVLQAA